MDKRFILKITLSISIIVLLLGTLSIFIVDEKQLQVAWIEFIIKGSYLMIILHIIALAYYKKKHQ